MKRAYAASKYAKPCEKYCREKYPDEAERIFARAEERYRELVKNDMPDLGENMMAATAVITGTWATKAPRSRRIRTCRKYNTEI